MTTTVQTAEGSRTAIGPSREPVVRRRADLAARLIECLSSSLPRDLTSSCLWILGRVTYGTPIAQEDQLVRMVTRPGSRLTSMALILAKTLAFSTTKTGSARNLPCGYTPHSETINANGKESHNGRQRWEKG